MTTMYPLFVCCEHGEVSFTLITKEGCCQHTAGFCIKKVLTKSVRNAAKAKIPYLRAEHEKRLRSEKIVEELEKEE